VISYGVDTQTFKNKTTSSKIMKTITSCKKITDKGFYVPNRKIYSDKQTVKNNFYVKET